MGVKDLVKGILTEKENKRYAGLLRDKKVSYGEWITALEADAAETVREEAAGSPGTKRSKSTKAQSAEDEFVVICVGKGHPASGLYQQIGNYFAAHPEVLLLYGDEDVWEGAGKEKAVFEAENRKLPWFKPDWSPDLLDSCFYFGSVTAMRKTLFQQAAAAWASFSGAAHEWFSSAADLSSAAEAVTYEAGDFRTYEKWVHLCVGLAGGYAKASRSIGHLSRILFHCENAEEQNKFLQFSEYLKECGERTVREFREKYVSGSEPLVSVVILSKDHPKVLDKCLRGCETAAKRQGNPPLSYEVILVDNGSSAENRERAAALLGEQTAGGRRTVYLYQPQAFHFSKMCNMGAAAAEGKFLLFLNDDVELCEPGTMERLAALADRPWTGAAGLKLYYPNSVRIQHAGITNLPMGPVHKLQFLEDDKCYYYGANRGLRNVLAVTAACLMTAREKYLEAGGFAEELPIAFNDVDFCFRLYELGYQNVCFNDGHAYHHESLSRGDDESSEKLERMLGERKKLYAAHPEMEGRDPCYSVYLNREGLDVGIRPAYLTAGNEVQEVRKEIRVFPLKGYRQDACLLVRVEDCRDRRIVGYGVVLGDNNACYERMLLLRRQQEPDVGENMIYAVKLTGQYRPDLEENMPDQINVGLCGFLVETGTQALPGGRYRLGMAAENRVTGLKIVNWSNRILEM